MVSRHSACNPTMTGGGLEGIDKLSSPPIGIRVWGDRWVGMIVTSSLEELYIIPGSAYLLLEGEEIYKISKGTRIL